jgi:hypothetical protein
MASMKTTLASLAFATLVLASPPARATPSTTFWAPSTTCVQPFLVPHITYDTYFGNKPAPASGQTSPGPIQNPPIYPVTTGLTVGVLPWEKLQLEVGFDLLLPSKDPFFFNAKLGTPQGTFFNGSPALAAGVFALGTRSDGTDFDIVYAQAQENFPWGGYLSAGAYYGAGSKLLWTSSDGNVNRWGFMGAIAAPDIKVNLPGLKKMVPVADIQTGKNIFGAAGGGLYFYFNDAIDLLTGPLFFFDKALQPGGHTFFWTVQLDVDMALFSRPEQSAPAAPATPVPPGKSEG